MRFDEPPGAAAEVLRQVGWRLPVRNLAADGFKSQRADTSAQITPSIAPAEVQRQDPGHATEASADLGNHGAALVEDVILRCARENPFYAQANREAMPAEGIGVDAARQREAFAGKLFTEDVEVGRRRVVVTERRAGAANIEDHEGQGLLFLRDRRAWNQRHAGQG